MKTPDHLRHSMPADTFRYIAAWAQSAADTYDLIGQEYDQGSERAVHLRHVLIDCSAQIWAAIALANPDAQWRLVRGLDAAQRTIGPIGWAAEQQTEDA